ncbi:MAG TPA: glycosyltransferase, partial [Thermoanaerobaculia bacterium]|nr:glycosyltransferase [Thermoanaerobaculia bacterium]
MKILIASVQVPFVRGGAEILAEDLEAALLRAGHQAALVRVPLTSARPESLLDQVLACRLFDLAETPVGEVDRVIGLKFPAYLVPHPNKVLWLLHQHRQAYDLWPQGGLDLVPGGRRLRDSLRRIERDLLAEVRATFAIAANVAHRVERFWGRRAAVLYPPPRLAGRLFSAPAEDYLFFPSRITSTKRHRLVLEALARTSRPVRLVLAGAPDGPRDRDLLVASCGELGLGARVEWLEEVDDERLLDLYARCRAVVFPPHDEDYGYVTLEAMFAGKPVVTCSDSGGPLEFVRAGEHRLEGDVAVVLVVGREDHRATARVEIQ